MGLKMVLTGLFACCANPGALAATPDAAPADEPTPGLAE